MSFIIITDCPNPNFDSTTTNIVGEQNWRFKEELSVTCKTGYTYLSEEFTGTVELKCLLGGRWSKNIPICKRKFN